MCRLYIITYYIRYPVSDTPRYAIAPQWSVQCFLGCSVTLLLPLREREAWGILRV